MIFRLAAVCSLLFAVQQHAAYAQDQAPAPHLLPGALESIVSDVSIEKNGEIEVVQTYTVRINGHRLNGLNVTLPLRGDPCANPPRFIGARILSVTRNGTLEKWTVVRPPAGVRKPNILRTGTRGVHLSDGEHVFAVRYRARGQVRESGPMHEIHCSFGGFRAGVKIALARIRLPEPVEFQKVALFTGRYGAIGDRAHVTEQGAGYVAIASKGSLDPVTGITAVLSWKKGIVNIPPPTEAEIAAAQKQRKHEKEFNCLTSSISKFDLAEVIGMELSLWN